MLTKTGFVVERAKFLGAKPGKHQNPQKLTGSAVETKWENRTFYKNFVPVGKIQVLRKIGQNKPVFQGLVFKEGRTLRTKIYKTNGSARKAVEALHKNA